MRLLSLVLVILVCLWQLTSGDDRKIAFLFLTKGPLPLEDVWREFFRWRANSSLYTVYVHPHSGYKYPTTSFFHGKDIAEKVNVKWGGMTQVKAIKRLVQAALKDPLNTWFTLMSETCIPLIPFPKFRRILLANNKSVVNACAMSPGEMETDTRWRSTLDTVGLKKSDWRKSATWFALTRKHAWVFVNETKTEDAWDAVPCCDEHYLPTMLAYNGLDNETTCTDGFAHVNWPSLIASHPRTYTGDDINAELFAFLERTQKATAGFSMQCSGFEEICHFTARKFAATSKYQLLENMDLILSEEGHPYTGNPWDHHQDKLRYKKEENKYYLIENGVLREIPDDHTFNALHLKKSGNSSGHIQSWTESEGVPLGPPFPSRRDGLILKTKKNNQVWYLKDGHRHAIPNIATFQSMNLSFEHLLIVSDSDLDQINVGHSIPSV